MKNTWRGCLTCLLVVVIGHASWADGTKQPALVVDGRTFTITTGNLVATFRDGRMVSLVSSQTNESFAADPQSAIEARKTPCGLATLAGADQKLRTTIDTVHKWAGAFDSKAAWPFQHRPTELSKLEVKELASGHYRATWLGLAAEGSAENPDESFTLEIRADAATGDLEIAAGCEAKAKGVYGCGLGLSNLSRELTFILPVLQGFSFRPSDQKPLTYAAHWPHPWGAAMLVVQGKQSSAAIWSADTKMGDRYLFLHSGQKAVDVAIESINPAPFDESTSA